MIRRILAKLRRRKAKPSLGRYFHQSVLAFNNGTKLYFNDSGASLGKPPLMGGAQKPEGPAPRPPVT